MKEQKVIPRATWAEIKKKYISGKVSMRALAREYGLSVSTISEKASRDHWKDAVEAKDKLAEQKIIEAVATAQASNAELAESIISTLMKKLEQSARIIDPEDTQAAKHITACMKDLRELEAFVVKPHNDGLKIELDASLDELAD